MTAEEAIRRAHAAGLRPHFTECVVLRGVRHSFLENGYLLQRLTCGHVEPGGVREFDGKLKKRRRCGLCSSERFRTKWAERAIEYCRELDRVLAEI